MEEIQSSTHVNIGAVTTDGWGPDFRFIVFMWKCWLLTAILIIPVLGCGDKRPQKFDSQPDNHMGEIQFQ